MTCSIQKIRAVFYFAFSMQELAEGTELDVLYDFEAQDSAELSVECGEVVVLRCLHDRIGCSEWWLVERGGEGQRGGEGERGGEGQLGYVPAAYFDKRTQTD